MQREGDVLGAWGPQGVAAEPGWGPGGQLLGEGCLVWGARGRRGGDGRQRQPDVQGSGGRSQLRGEEEGKPFSHPGWGRGRGGLRKGRSGGPGSRCPKGVPCALRPHVPFGKATVGLGETGCGVAGTGTVKRLRGSGGAWLVPSEEHVTLDLGVVSLSPMLCVEIT